jgi:hypothetical protein
MRRGDVARHVSTCRVFPKTVSVFSEKGSEGSAALSEHSETFSEGSAALSEYPETLTEGSAALSEHSETFARVRRGFPHFLPSAAIS